MQEIQRDHLERDFGDIGPNFVVGGEGLIFEGRGANIMGAMISKWNMKCISIMFTGDYTIVEPDAQQINNVKILLDALVRGNFIIENYQLLGHCQIISFISPGANLMARLWEFEHWRPVNMSQCPSIT